MPATKQEALTAIRVWMGSYEGRHGEMLDTLVAAGIPDDVIESEEEIPADMIAGYRLALRQEAAWMREMAIEKDVRRFSREYPDLTPKHIRQVITKNYDDAMAAVAAAE